MHSRALIAALLLAACAPRPDLPIHLHEALRDDTEAVDVVFEAASAFGMEPAFRDSPRGAISVMFVDGPIDDVAEGRTPRVCQRPCRRLVLSDYSARVLGHEIGHALGLAHHKGATNLMHAPASEYMHLRSWQRAIAEESALRLERCQ